MKMNHTELIDFWSKVVAECYRKSINPDEVKVEGENVNRLLTFRSVRFGWIIGPWPELQVIKITEFWDPNNYTGLHEEFLLRHQ
jgi:hypothetical protein